MCTELVSARAVAGMAMSQGGLLTLTSTKLLSGAHEGRQLHARFPALIRRRLSKTWIKYLIQKASF